MKLYFLRHEKRDIGDARFYSPLLTDGLRDANNLKPVLNKLNINDIIKTS